MEDKCNPPKNIYIVGAQCTGKTTLVNALAEHFKDPSHRVWKGNIVPEPLLIKEVARDVLRKHRFTALDITSSPERALQLQKLILEAQHQAEEEAGMRWYLSDRSALDPIIYARVYVGEEAAFAMLRTETWIRSLEKMRTGLVFICEAGNRWLFDDGVRLMPKDQEEWMSFHQIFCDTLRELDIEFAIVSREMTSLSERMNFVVQTWQACIEHPARLR